ncbi:group II dsDNA virus coat/capsid protein [Blyttiomyces helicus]|uniref:Group II dsDNA virus coat/capsid protein n=1 Tax=Blyttiomyces helicus TaxID=388810 RepID=A0A4P9WNY0_9FUNG|nr:group II dsDNA virus coat/capsid protein [Blyttiomyces helicus]|eukprot:RKO94851.1 group II dsDNA virus coat/capsid protein [Blyttiomyces helicus]
MDSLMTTLQNSPWVILILIAIVTWLLSRQVESFAPMAFYDGMPVTDENEYIQDVANMAAYVSDNVTDVFMFIRAKYFERVKDIPFSSNYQPNSINDKVLDDPMLPLLVTQLKSWITSSRNRIERKYPADRLIDYRKKNDLFFTQDPNSKNLKLTFIKNGITPFAKNVTIIPFNEQVSYGKRITATIPCGGDLLHGIKLYFKLPAFNNIPVGSSYLGWTQSVGYASIDEIELRIGETIIDKHSGLFMETMDYLKTNVNDVIANNVCVGRYDTINVLPQNASEEIELYIPLQFWFNKKLSSSLPLVAMKSQSVKIVVILKNFEDIVTYDGEIAPEPVQIVNSGAVVDFYLLSEPERNLFTHGNESFLIERWQYDFFPITQGLSTSKFQLEFNNSIKELVFFVIETESERNNDFFNIGIRSSPNQGSELLKYIGLRFDGKDRFEKMPESYYRNVTVGGHTYKGNRNIYVISFAEFPESNQPSGTANFSCYDTVELTLDFINNVPSATLWVLGISYNKLDIDADNISLLLL